MHRIKPPHALRAVHLWAALMTIRQTWLFDLGNTRLKWARADELIANDARAQAHDAATPEAACAEVRAGDRAWIASVATNERTQALESALTQRGARIVRAKTRKSCAGVRIAYAQPSRLGVDRFLALLAAHARAPRPWLIASVGTALTIDLLDADGLHRGGLIAPSPTLMREALTARAPHLPLTGGAVVDFAADTTDALASGAIGAARALIAQSLRAARRQIEANPTLLITGGGADALCEDWRVRAQRMPDLVLHGLRTYARIVRG
jgi:type III pantothenate kinase